MKINEIMYGMLGARGTYNSKSLTYALIQKFSRASLDIFAVAKRVLAGRTKLVGIIFVPRCKLQPALVY